METANKMEEENNTSLADHDLDRAGHENDLTLMVENNIEPQQLDSSSTHESSDCQRDQESTSDCSDELFFILSEDHFSDDVLPDTSSRGGGDHHHDNDQEEEEDFDLPVDVSSIEREIRKYIKLIRFQGSSDEQKKRYISKLCQLRVRLNQMTECNFEKYLNGHKFVSDAFNDHSSASSILTCDVCLGRQPSIVSSIIAKYSSFVANNYNFISNCQFCGFSIHKKCLISILGHRHNHENFFTNTIRVRKCPSVFLLQEEEEENIIMDICPEIGLLKQDYRCNDCHCTILNLESCRLDDYDGRYYCHSCHWNDTHPTPARLIHNWDPSPFPVSRKSLQILHYIKPVKLFDLMTLNSMLFGLIPELAMVKRIRVEVAQMTSYIRCCLYQPNKPNLSHYKPHLLDESKLNLYSIFDLIHFKALQESLQELKGKLFNHITIECQGCRGKGFFCTLCRDKSDLLFPFSSNISNCPDCGTVYHRTCFHRKHKLCLKCTRRESLSGTLEQLSPPPPSSTEQRDKELDEGGDQ